MKICARGDSNSHWSIVIGHFPVSDAHPAARSSLVGRQQGALATKLRHRTARYTALPEERSACSRPRPTDRANIRPELRSTSARQRVVFPPSGDRGYTCRSLVLD